MSALLFGWVFSLLLRKKAPMITVWCRHAHSDWHSTEVFSYVTDKSYNMLTWTYTTVLDV